MNSIIDLLQHSIINLGALGVFLVSIVEEIIVPIPSTMVQAGAGAILLGGQSISIITTSKLIFWVALPAAIGVTIGSLVIYAIAYYGGMLAIKKYGKYFFLSYEKIEIARLDIVSKPGTIKAITILRFLPIFPNSIITAVSGILKIPIRKYVVSTIIGVFIRALYLAALGWFTSSLYTKEFNSVSMIGRLVSIVGVLVLVSSVTALLISLKKKN